MGCMPLWVGGEARGAIYPVEISRKIRQLGNGISGKDSVFHYSALESWQGLLAYRELNAFGPG